MIPSCILTMWLLGLLSLAMAGGAIWLAHEWYTRSWGWDEVALDQESEGLIAMAMSELNLSARAYDRILKVARTIADLEGSESIRPSTSAKRSSTAAWTATCLAENLSHHATRRPLLARFSQPNPSPNPYPDASFAWCSVGNGNILKYASHSMVSANGNRVVLLLKQLGFLRKYWTRARVVGGAPHPFDFSIEFCPVVGGAACF